MKTLLLHSSYTDQMSYFDDWVDAFKVHRNFQSECINVFNASQDFTKGVSKKIESVDLIILHHSMNGDTLDYLKPFMSALKNRKGKLVSFVGNEVNLPILGMAAKIKNLQEIKPDIIATQLLEEAGLWLYEDCTDSKVISLPHALNPKAFLSKREILGREIDIGTRSSRYGVYIGDNDRNNIISFFHENSKNLNLKVDLGLDSNSQKRFNRDQWSNFLESCKATLSTEAGSFYLEKDDKIINEIKSYLTKKSTKIVLPHDSFAREVYRRLVPSYVRSFIVSMIRDKVVEVDKIDNDCDFEEIYEKFFATAAKAPVYTKAISSRHFDAIGTGTLNVMYPGRYNDVLVPGEHYFELKRDHSNVDDLKDILADERALTKVTRAAYEHVIAEHTHEKRLDKLLTYL